MSTPAAALPAQGGGIGRDEISQMVRQAMSGLNGDNSGKVQELLTDNFTLREAKRQLTADNEALKARVPVDGAIVLTGDDAKAYKAFVDLKLKPEEIVVLQTEVTDLRSKTQESARKTSIDAAAAAEEYVAAVLTPLVIGQDLIVKPVIEDVDGEKKSVDRAFIQTKGANGVVTEQRLSEFIEAKHKPFLPALMAESGGSDDDVEGSTAKAAGTPHVRQRGSTGTKGTQKPNPAADLIAKRYGQNKAGHGEAAK